MVVKAEVVYAQELRVAASPATVFQLLTEPEGLTSWMGSRPQLDPRPGGIFRLELGEATVRGEFVEVVPEERVVFTWGWEGGEIPLGPGESTVEFTLTPDGEDTIIRLKHSGLTPRVREFHTWGWANFLPRLTAVAERKDPGPDPTEGVPREFFVSLLGQERE